MIYNDYIRVMTCMHQKLKHTYNQFCLKLLTEEQRSKYQLFPETGGLSLPGAEVDSRKENSPVQGESKSSVEDLQENLIEETKEGSPNDSFAEMKQENFTAIPQLRNNKNALNRTSLPFSARLFSGHIKVDHKDIHAVAN